MKYLKRIIFIGVFIGIFTSLSATAQQNKIDPPTKGKAVIYIMRTSSLGALMNFRFFDKNKYLGKFKGTNYLRYECDPGKSVLWVKAENIDFIETDLEADKIYFVEANAVLGAFSAGVKYRIVDYDDEKQMKRIQKLLNTKDPKVFTEEELKEAQMSMASVIQKGMKKIQKKRKKKKKIKYIRPNMNYVLQ